MYLADEVLQHLLGDGEIGDHAIFHRSNSDNIAGGTTQHTLGFHAYGGDVRAGDRAVFLGSILTTGDIIIGKDSAIRLIQATAVPEPGAAIMLTIGGILIAWRKRRRAKPNTSV